MYRCPYLFINIPNILKVLSTIDTYAKMTFWEKVCQYKRNSRGKPQTGLGVTNPYKNTWHDN